MAGHRPSGRLSIRRRELRRARRQAGPQGLTKKVLISGGHSVLGRGLSDRLRNDGYEVWQGSRRAVDAPFSCLMDVADAAQVRSAVEAVQPSLIFHLAASYEREFQTAFDVNVNGARHVIEAVADLKIASRILVMGSAAEYGVVEPEENPVSENRSTKPVSIYGMTKAWQTMWCQKQALEGHDVVVARMFNLDAPGLPCRLFLGNLERMIAAVMSGQRARIETGPLSATRDYIGLHQAIDQLLAIARAGIRGSVYHVASGRPITMRQLLEKQLASAGLGADLVDENTASG
ncbi:MAG: NAD-dependent epimerase/dehydratase family protein, partial [Hyphomicrobiales bacterium]